MRFALLSLIPLQEWLFWVFRVAAGLGTAALAYLVLGPITRLLGRVAFHRTLPNWFVSTTRIMGAILIGVLVYYYLPIGGGPGWGPGSGGPGEGKGSGFIKDGDQQPGTSESGKDKSASKSDKTETEAPKDILQIELLGGKRYQRDERYYLLARKEPAKTLSEVDEYLGQNLDKYKIVHVILTKESVSEEDPAVSRLQRLAQQKYKLAAPIVLP